MDDRGLPRVDSASSRANVVLAMVVAATMVALAAWLGAPRTAALPSLASITLTPVADAYVSQAQPATNFNNAASWPVRRDSSLRESYPLLQFDLSAIPDGSEVSSAELGMYLATATALAATLTASAPTSGTPGDTHTPGTPTGSTTPSPTMGPVVALLCVPSAERP